MSKFSSYKESQLLFENWRKHINGAPQKSLISEQEANLGGDMYDLEDTDPASPSYVSSDRPSEFNMDLLAKQSRKSRDFLVSLVRKFVKSDNTFNTTAFFNLFDRPNAMRVLIRYAKGLQQLKNDLDELGFDINLDIKKLIVTDDGLIELEYATEQILEATGFITQPLKTNEAQSPEEQLEMPSGTEGPGPVSHPGGSLRATWITFWYRGPPRSNKGCC